MYTPLDDVFDLQKIETVVDSSNARLNNVLACSGGAQSVH